MRVRNTVVGLGIVALAAAGCSSEDETDEATTTAAAAVTCEAHPDMTDPTLDPAPLGGTTIESSQVLDSVDQPGFKEAVLRICGTDVSGDALKDLATEYALAIKATPLGETLWSLRVTNTSVEGDAGRVRCEDFQLYTFTGDPGAVRASWKLADEN